MSGSRESDPVLARLGHVNEELMKLRGDLAVMRQDFRDLAEQVAALSQANRHLTRRVEQLTAK